MNWDRARGRDAVRPDLASGGRSVGHGQAPTPKQLDYLAALAREAGEALAPPLTRAHASREIDRLRKKLGKT